MGITHVVRGQDHVSNTPRQVMLLRALGEEPPVYAHIPLLHGPDGKKLSKRHGAASVQEVRDGGYLPEAVRNYIALLGWGYDESTEFMTTDELVERFSLERVSKNPAVFDEQKLRWMNGRYLKELPLEELHRRLEKFYGREIPIEIVAIAREKMQTLADFWPLAGTLIEAPTSYDDKAWQQWGSSPHLPAVRAALADRAHVGHVCHRGIATADRRRTGRQAQGDLPADSRGPDGDNRVPRDLRIGRRTGPREDARTPR